MELTDIMRELALRGVSTSMAFNKEFNILCIDLDTQAKSHLYLYEDGTILGRYNYANRLDFSNKISDTIYSLCGEFSKALHGRSYGNSEWFNLCKKLEVKCEIYM